MGRGTASGAGANGGIVKARIRAACSARRAFPSGYDRGLTFVTDACHHMVAPDGRMVDAIWDCSAAYTGTLVAVDVASGGAQELAQGVAANGFVVARDSSWVAWVADVKATTGNCLGGTGRLEVLAAGATSRVSDDVLAAVLPGARRQH